MHILLTYSKISIIENQIKNLDFKNIHIFAPLSPSSFIFKLLEKKSKLLFQNFQNAARHRTASAMFVYASTHGTSVRRFDHILYGLKKSGGNEVENLTMMLRCLCNDKKHCWCVSICPPQTILSFDSCSLCGRAAYCFKVENSVEGDEKMVQNWFKIEDHGKSRTELEVGNSFAIKQVRYMSAMASAGDWWSNEGFSRLWAQMSRYSNPDW